MRVEMSLDTPQIEDQNPLDEASSAKPEDTQTISGSQVACSFGRLDAQRNKESRESWQAMVLTSLSAVMILAGLYMAIVLLL